MKNKIPLKAGDFVIFAAIIALACGIWIRLALMQTDQTYGEILVNGELYRQVKRDSKNGLAQTAQVIDRLKEKYQKKPDQVLMYVLQMIMVIM